MLQAAPSGILKRVNSLKRSVRVNGKYSFLVEARPHNRAPDGCQPHAQNQACGIKSALCAACWIAKMLRQRIRVVPATFSIVDRAAKWGIIKANTAARYKSRITLRLRSLTAA